MAGAPCFEDGNCSGTLVCYDEPDWAPPGSPKRFCDCESWYGTTGELCQSFGTGAVVQIAWFSIMLIYNLAGLCAATMISRSFLALPRAQRAMYVIVSSLSLVLCFSFLAGALHRCTELAVFLTPEAHTLLEPSPSTSGTAKVHQQLDFQRTVSSILISLIALVCVSLPLSWIEEFMWFPGVNSSRILVELHGFEVAILVLDVGIVVVTTTFQPGESTVLLSAFMLPIVAGVGWIYLRLPRRLIAVASDKEEEPNAGLLELTRMLRRTRGLVLFGTFITLVGAGSTAATVSTYRSFDKPGDLSLGWLSFGVVVTGIELLMLAVLYYVWRIKKGSEVARTSQVHASKSHAERTVEEVHLRLEPQRTDEDGML